MSKVDRRAQLIVNIKVEHTKQSQYLNISGKTDCHHKSRPHSPVSIRSLGISQPSWIGQGIPHPLNEPIQTRLSRPQRFHHLINGQLPLKNIEYNCTETKPLTIPSCSKIDHRLGSTPHKRCSKATSGVSIVLILKPNCL